MVRLRIAGNNDERVKDMRDRDRRGDFEVRIKQDTSGLVREKK